MAGQYMIYLSSEMEDKLNNFLKQSFGKVLKVENAKVDEQIKLLILNLDQLTLKK